MDFDLQVERFYSAQEDRRRTTPKLTAQFSGEFSPKISWDWTVTGEVRFFERHNEDERRVDFRYTVYAGVNFAKQIDPGAKFLQNPKLGILYVQTSSNTKFDSSTGARLARDYSRQEIL